MDDPSLHGKPLAVQQFNSGGFVAVSYEARAAGIRCGDGVGAAGRSQIARLKEMGSVSVAEACRRCPGLVVKQMRTDRYRQVGGRTWLCAVRQE
jgi:nucleotidyltransferase/DNA polymerase involved in DNA repair